MMLNRRATRSTVPNFGNATLGGDRQRLPPVPRETTFVSATFDELWGFTSERSRRLWDEMSHVAGSQDFGAADDNLRGLPRRERIAGGTI